MLDMTALDLIKRGFFQEIIEGEKVYEDQPLSPLRIVYKKETINGYFYFNPTELTYRWYHRTVIGSGMNDVHLNIATADELDIILKAFDS